jgi:hypothetical protein
VIENAEEEWLRRFSDAALASERWRQWASKPQELPTSSQLCVDETAGVPEVRLIAWHGIVTAIDHLGIIRDAAAANDGVPRPPGMAYQSAARGALLSACRSLWILSEDDPSKRRLRALRSAVADAVSGHRAAKAAKEAWPEEVEMTTATLAGAAQELSSLKARTRKLADRHLKLPDIGETQTVKEVAAFLKDTEPDLADALVVTWNMTSGFAHGFRWVGDGALQEPKIADVSSSVNAAALCTGRAIRAWLDRAR